MRYKKDTNEEDSLNQIKIFESTIEQLKCFYMDNKINIKPKIIESAIHLYEESKKRSVYIKMFQMSFSIKKEFIYICLYKNNNEYIYFKFNNKGIKYHKELCYKDLKYRQKYIKINDFFDILNVLDEFGILVNWNTPYN